VCRNRTLFVLFNIFLEKCEVEEVRVKHKTHSQHDGMKRKIEHGFHLFAEFIKDKMFLDKLHLEDDVDTLDHQYHQYPQVIVAQIKEIKCEDVARMHQVEQVRAFIVIAVDLIKHGQKRR